MKMRKLAVATGMLLLAAGAVEAQEKFPVKPVRIVVGFTPGSATDFLARAIAQKLAESWGQQFVVDNRAGAGGVIASEICARAAPDGYTLMVVAVGHAVNASLFSKLPYDTLKDFAGVTYLADVPNVLISAPALGFKSIRDLINFAKAKPQGVNYGSAGLGSSTHITAELFNMAAGIKVVHVPYKGSPDVMTNTIAGTVQYGFVPVNVGAPLIKSGKVTGLGVSTKARSPVLPDMPTIGEEGLPGFEFSAWYGMVAPARTPAAIKEQLAQEIARVVTLPDMRDRLLTQGATPNPTSPDEFNAFVKREVERFGEVVKAAGIQVN